jgi:glutamate/tyrosine decarboxylase-like PLP-dependent enzyme
MTTVDPSEQIINGQNVPAGSCYGGDSAQKCRFGNLGRNSLRGPGFLTRLLEALLAELGFRVLEGGELSVACARWEPRDQTGDAIDRLQNTIAREVVSSGEAWFSTTRHAGRNWLRFNMVNLYTREHHVRQLADILRTTAERATSEESKWKK